MTRHVESGRRGEFEAFRRTLGHVPTGVTVITGMCEGRPVGMAAGSFSSISLDPPLVGFFVAKSSTTWPLIQAGGRFCANVLGSGQLDLCTRFARSGGDKFAGLPWSTTGGGVPLLDGVLAWVDCRIKYVYDAGDHELCIGLVEGLGEPDPTATGVPLVFFRGRYGTIEQPPDGGGPAEIHMTR